MLQPGGWFTCRVEQAGPSDWQASVLVQLSDLGGKFNHLEYKAADSVKREILATALTAISTGLSVEAQLESIDQHSTLYTLRLRRT